MPFIAHTNDFTLGVGDFPSGARGHASAHDVDALWVSPATRALVASIENDGQPLIYEDHPLPALVNGVYCLAEERQALREERSVCGFDPAAIRDEVDALSMHAAVTPDALAELYGPLGSHPDYPVEDWADAARHHVTRQGYWPWVAQCLNDT